MREHAITLRVALLACYMIALASACGGGPQTRRIEVVSVDRSCLDAAEIPPPPRPDPAAAELLAPPPWMWWLEFCARAETALALENFIRRTQRWIAEAEAACRLPTLPPDHSGPNQDDGGTR